MRNIFAILLILGLYACEKDKVGNLDCLNFQTGIVERNEAVISDEIEKLTPDLEPLPTPEDLIGHMANLNTLVDRINYDCEEINASILCYACIETYPLQSEIEVEFNYENTTIRIILDIITSESDILRYGGMHETSLQNINY